MRASVTGGTRVLYTAFDAYPGFKGAQAHIRTNLKALADRDCQVTLLCLGSGGSFRDPATGAMARTFAAEEPNMLRRSELFGRFLRGEADLMAADPPDIIHFRDIWSGIPLLSHCLSGESRLVFEVNGLPSVELPDHYPRLAGNAALLARLRSMEDECLARADRVITVCRLTARYLADRGCDEGKIVVIPNAADPPGPSETCPAGKSAMGKADLEGRKVILYTGTLASWQGLPTLVEALKHLRHRNDFCLVVAASAKKGVARLRRQARAAGLSDKVAVLYGVGPRAMSGLYRRAYLSVAPLARGARNEVQGCCPLKIVESMASGAPVVGSDLPVVRELVSTGSDGVLVPPGSARAFANTLNSLMDDEALRDRLARGASEKARRDFGTGLFEERLQAVYNSLTGGEKHGKFRGGCAEPVQVRLS